ncbi:hypothetical protein PIB30_033060 [Stylosanthes scabra]|uniref:Uncharacterized protein n=1 Tax=Stylosanthes scabra TaxID=79078 RepID=A0ABU6ZAX3_9FABA|nr:hypothetical protein [Stylosanthes scabra]
MVTTISVVEPLEVRLDYPDELYSFSSWSRKVNSDLTWTKRFAHNGKNCAPRHHFQGIPECSHRSVSHHFNQWKCDPHNLARFTMRLTDPTLSQRIKIQVQLIGATQDAAAEQATLHHQVLYRVQDHALDLKLPNSTGDALLMFHDKNHGPAIVNIPRMITTEEFSSIVPLEWITNYEKAFPQQIPDVHTTTPPRITRASDGTHTAHPDDPPVHYYDNGKHVYVSHIQDYDCQDWNDWSDSEDEDYARRRRKSKKKKKQSCTVSKRPDPPDEPDYKSKFSLKRRSQKSYQDYSTANPQVVPCIATLGSYDHDFPPLQTSADDARVTRRPYITPPQGVSPHGYQAVTPQEEVLNWHTDNALNQNKMLNRIDHRLGTLEEKVDETSTHMSHLQAHIKELRDRLAT